MKLEEYNSLTEKEPFFRTTTITTSKEFDETYEILSGKGLLYRGIHEAKYKIYTSAQREWITNEYSQQGIDFTHFIQSIINNIRKNSILSNYYKSLNINENDLLYISLLQHHGAPTPLLDFTYDLNTALYFALEKVQPTASNMDIDNFFSIYIINKEEYGNEFVDIISLLDHGLVSGTGMLKDFIAQNPNSHLDYSLLSDVDKYTKWIKQDGSNDGLCKMDCGFLNNPLNSSTISMFETNEILYWSNINLIAQKGCFVFYTKDNEPLEQYFGGVNKYLSKLKCINIHKSLACYIKKKYLQGLSKNDIYPDLNILCKIAYGQFKESLH